MSGAEPGTGPVTFRAMFTEQLRAQREQMGLLQREFADKAHVSLSSVKQYVRGAKTASMASGLPFSGLAGDLHAARSYSLISPPRTLRRRISAIAGPVILAGTFSLPSGGRRSLARCGR